MKNKNERNNEIKKSFWKGKNAMPVYFVIGIVLIMGVVAFSALNKPEASETPSQIIPSSGDFQEVRMIVNGASYLPSQLTVQAGKPVKWIVDGTKAVGCTRYLVAPSIGVSKKLDSGENVIEFTPTEKGAIGFSCSMGMVRGTMNVV